MLPATISGPHVLTVRSPAPRELGLTDRVGLLAVAAALPPQARTSAEVEALIEAHSPDYRVRPGLVEAMSGIRARRVAADDVQCSDLAAEAGQQALAAAGLDARDVDLLVFAAAGQDLVEPATAHIVQHKLGTRCQVFDVKNACNSFLNGLQLAEALILGGSCATALVVTGEVCSRAVDWRVDSDAAFRRNFPGYTMGDAGAAALLARVPDGRGIYFRRFTAMSEHWPLATIAAGGSMFPRGAEHTYLRGDGAGLRRAFHREGPPAFCRMLAEAGARYDDFRRIVAHQVSVPYRREMAAACGMPAALLEPTVEELGNMAAASIPVALAQAQARGSVGPGDRVLCVGMASGISIGVVMLEL